jgi:aspartyl/asparaginyl-tRNA synthetase
LVANLSSIAVTQKIATTEELSSASPLAQGLALTLSNGSSFGGSSSYLMKTIATLAPASCLLGSGDHEAAQVDSWVTYGTTNFDVPIAALKAAIQAGGTADDSLVASIKKDIDYSISVLNCHLLPQTYMVGSQITVADIALALALRDAATEQLWDPSSDDEKTTHVRKWYNSLLTSDFWNHVTSSGRTVATSEPTASCPDSKDVSLHGVAPAVKNKLYKRNRIRIKEVLNDPSYVGKTVTVAGWTRTLRKAGAQLLFLEINDGSCGASIQCTCEASATEGFEDAKKCGGTGSSFQLTGVLVESPSEGQVVELKVTIAKLLGAVYGGDIQGNTVGGMLYPMSKKAHTLEHMREHAHLRPRSGLHAAAMRVRHAMAYATHKFFHDHGFLYIHTPIITCADCEGAGEQFAVTTMLGNDPNSKDIVLPLFEEEVEATEKKLSKKEQKRLAKMAAKEKVESIKPEEVKIPGAVDYTKDFFGRRGNLTVSGQLNVETHACALSDVYTFGPTFRAENSHTSRHLSEFWMIEPEIAFADLEDDINLAEDYLKYCVQYALEMCAEDLEFFESSPFGEKGLRERLRNVLNNPFKVRLSD